MIVNNHHKEPRREAGALGWQVYRSEEISPEQTKVPGATPDTGFVPTTYTLTEKSTSEGYNIMTTPIAVTIDEDGNATIGEQDNVAALDSIITVNNQSGTVLPSTGGIGTTIFYVVGALLVIGAGVVLVTRRRMNVQ